MSVGLRIVLAEDNPSVRRLLGIWLTNLGHVVLPVADGRALVDICLRLSPDLVVSDVEMPDLDGVTAAEEIHRERDIPLILMSGGWTADGLDRAMALGAQCLEKPLQPATLVAAIEAALGEPARG